MSEMKFQLSSEQRELVGTIRDLARSKFKDRVVNGWTARSRRENMRDLAQLGILGVCRARGIRWLRPSGVRHRARARGSLEESAIRRAMALMGEVGVQVRVISTYAPDTCDANILPKSARASRCSPCA